VQSEHDGSVELNVQQLLSRARALSSPSSSSAVSSADSARSLTAGGSSTARSTNSDSDWKQAGAPSPQRSTGRGEAVQAHLDSLLSNQEGKELVVGMASVIAVALRWPEATLEQQVRVVPARAAQSRGWHADAM
jgi:hypothetical protein